MAAIHKFAHEGERIETGVVQFGEDWPGIFIRGDQAIGMSELLKVIAARVPASEADLLKRISDLLGSCRVSS